MGMMGHRRRGAGDTSQAGSGDAEAVVDAIDGTTTSPTTDDASSTTAPMPASRAQGTGYVLIAIVYLLGLFIGALDTGIVTPCRTVIQNDLGMGEQLGVWIITIYTLAYAASIPVMGKLADKHGRKWIYLVSIMMFGVGSLFCGLAQDIGSYQVLLIARAVQAFGGGGIMPVATAEFGTAFPPEKRGMALGLVGGVYGIANIFGASAGSLVLDIFGQHNWQFVFYINLPICLFIIIAGIIALPNSRAEEVKPIDGLGICVLTVMVLSLLYGLKNLDFFDFVASIATRDVYPFLIAFLVLLPIFIAVERRAIDPIINLSYFKNASIVITLLLAIVTGIVMMGMIFIPQFAENAMKLKSGAGGYFVIILALFAGVGAPVSGKLIDKAGVKMVLGFGLVCSVAGALFLALVACSSPNIVNVVISLVLIGLGMGFTMGTPLNYMMLQKTDEREANSALATLSLVRSIGTAVAPAIMVAFLAHAGTTMQDRIMDVLPTEVTVSPLPYARELDAEFASLNADPDTADLLAGMDIPDLESMQTIEVAMDSTDEGSDTTYTISDETKQQLQDSDVTTITQVTKNLVSEMFDQLKPDLESDATGGIDQGISGMSTARDDMDTDISDMNSAMDELDSGIAGIDDGLEAQRTALSQMEEYLPMLQQLDSYSSVLDFIPDSAKASIPQSVLDELADVKTADDLRGKISELDSAMGALSSQVSTMTTARDGASTGIAQMKAARDALQRDLDADLAKIDVASDEAAAAEGSSDGSATDGSATDGSATDGSATDGSATDGTGATPAEDAAAKRAAIATLDQQIAAAQAQLDALDSGIARMNSVLESQGAAKTMMQEQLPTLEKLENYDSVLDLMPDSAKAAMPQSALDELSDVRTASDLEGKISELEDAMASMEDARDEMTQAKDDLASGIEGITSAKAELGTTLDRMVIVKAAIPGTFDEAEENYLALIDEDSDQIETVFQTTLDEGFRQMFLLVAICSAVGLVVLLFYRDESRKTRQG